MRPFSVANPYRALAEAGELLAAGRPALARDLAAKFLDHEDAAHRRRAERLVAEADEVIAAATGPVVELGDDEVPWSYGEEAFASFVELLTESLAAGYREQPARFRRACIALAEDRPDLALPLFEELVEEEPEDLVRRLGRGQARLYAGSFKGAVADLESVWPLLGDRHLDYTEMLSVPLLWAEAKLGEGEPEAVVERLAELVDELGDPALASLYGCALLNAGHPAEEVLSFFARARDRHYHDENLSLWTAHLLAESGRLEVAIELLERLVSWIATPQRPLLHSLRMLLDLRLRKARRDYEPPDPRCSVLCEMLTYAVDGEPTAEDRVLVATFHALSGDSAAAADLEIQAERMAGKRRS